MAKVFLRVIISFKKNQEKKLVKKTIRSPITPVKPLKAGMVDDSANRTGTKATRRKSETMPNNIHGAPAERSDRAVDMGSKIRPT